MAQPSASVATRVSALRRGLTLPAPTTAQLLSLYLLAGVVFASAAGMLVTDPDIWWHLRSGQLIAESNAIPRADVFSWSAAGEPWVAHSWLADVLFYGAWRGGGFRAVLLLTAGLLTLTFWVLLALVRRASGNHTLAVAVTALAALTAMVGWTPRPHQFTLLFTAVFLYCLWRGARETPRTLWALPFVMLLWVNLHAGFVTGFLLLGAWLAAAAVTRWTRRDAASAAALRRLALVSAACLAASWVNPWGPALWLYPLQYVGESHHAAYITEWFAPDFHRLMFLPLLLMLLLLLGTLALGAVRLTLTEVLLLVGFTYLALTSARHVPLFALVAAPILGRALAGAVRARRSGPPVVGAVTRRLPMALAMTHWVLAAVILGWVGMRVPKSTAWDDTVRVGAFPVGAVAYLRMQSEERRLFNHYNWGGFLIHQLWPRQRVFIDGRADLYGRERMDEYMTVARVDAGWNGVLDRLEIDTIVWRAEGPLPEVLRASGGWREVHRDGLCSVFERADLRLAAQALR